MAEDLGASEVVMALMSLFFGTGGIVAFYKARSDRRKGIKEESRADVDSLNARAIAISQAQFDLLVTPLREEVNVLRTEVLRLNEEVEKARDKYWDAILYIRNIISWVMRHFPERDDFPKPPDSLSEDVY